MNKSSDSLVISDSSTSLAGRPKVVIIGGGFGGINTAMKLRGASVDVIVVDRRNHHLFQPLLYQVATAGLNPGDIATPIRSILRKQQNARVVLGDAQRIDRENKTVELDIGTIDYDYLVVAPGTKPTYFDTDSFADNSTPLKSVEDALDLRKQILFAFEQAEHETDPEKVEEWLTFTIVGGGPTGVEMAGAIREIAAEVMPRDFRTIHTENTRVVLIDALPRVLSAYDEKLSDEAKDALEKRGVEVILDSPVNEIGQDYVSTEDENIPTRTVIWAAGVKPEPLVTTLDTELSDDGRVVVEENLTIPESNNIFVIGDASYFKHGSDDPLPGLAPVAIQQGKATARNIRKCIEGKPMEPFEYWDRGKMATIGRKAAIAEVGDWKFSGIIAWLAWLFVHILFLVGFRNRVMVLIQWAYSYVMFKRGSRLIVGDIKTDKNEPKQLETENSV